MAVNKVYVFCGILAAVLAWFATRRDIFTVKNEMFVGREASEVYELIADLRKHIKYHSFVPKEIVLLHTRTHSSGLEERLFLVKEYVPLPLGYNMTVNFDALAKLTKPNEELVVDIEVDMIGGVSGASVWTLVPSSIGDVRGTLVTEEFSLHCLRVTCGFIEHKAAVSHEELFQKLKEDLEKS
ncbi:uncharacterized protein LOC117290619 [Asterias rubens]|uniref:uncharacterized protein LOC117290619 n=1 Tax=Asterias rubens TaxID=7604 RepID=UPI0014558028|nr:uncharacterized protein LOC117290619 [Asterias rubens]